MKANGELMARIAELEAQQAVLVDALAGVVLEVKSLIDESEGLTGFHLNGDIAPWSEIVAGGRFERLTSIPSAHEALAAVKPATQFNAETNVAGLTTRKTCAARGFMFGNDDACWFYCVGGGCGSDEPCEHQQPAGQKGSE